MVLACEWWGCWHPHHSLAALHGDAPDAEDGEGGDDEAAERETGRVDRGHPAHGPVPNGEDAQRAAAEAEAHAVAGPLPVGRAALAAAATASPAHDRDGDD